MAELLSDVAGSEVAAASLSGGVSQAPGADLDLEEEEITDEELAALAREDPDLAALLRSDNLGQNFEKLVDKVDGEAGDEEEDGFVGDDGGDVEFGELFEAIDEVRGRFFCGLDALLIPPTCLSWLM
jgi:hypothetical protein